MENKNKKLVFLILTSKRFFKRLINMKLKNKIKFLHCANISLIICIFVLIFVSLIQSNMAASEGFVMNELDNELNDLKIQNKDFNLKSAELQDIGRIKKIAQERGMVLADNIDYIVIKDYKDVARK